MPLHCADCDANVWYRWNGRAYETAAARRRRVDPIGGDPGAGAEHQRLEAG